MTCRSAIFGNIVYLGHKFTENRRGSNNTFENRLEDTVSSASIDIVFSTKRPQNVFFLFGMSVMPVLASM